MGKPKSDADAVRAVIETLGAGGWDPVAVDDGDPGRTATPTPADAVLAIMGVDESTLFVQRDNEWGGSERGWVFFVLGNEPEEVVNDHTTNLSPVLDPLFESWEA